MKSSLLFSTIFAIFSLNLVAKDSYDLNQTAKEILDKAYKMFEESKKIIESYSNPTQEAIPQTEKGFSLYYKVIKNSANVEERNDFLIITQIKYKIGLEKELSLGDILVKTKGGTVELYGKTDSKEKADKIIDIALKTKGVKEVVSYLIIFQREVISL